MNGADILFCVCTQFDCCSMRLLRVGLKKLYIYKRYYAHLKKECGFGIRARARILKHISVFPLIYELMEFHTDLCLCYAHIWLFMQHERGRKRVIRIRKNKSFHFARACKSTCFTKSHAYSFTLSHYLRMVSRWNNAVIKFYFQLINPWSTLHKNVYARTLSLFYGSIVNILAPTQSSYILIKWFCTQNNIHNLN